MSEQYLLVCFHNEKVVALDFITDGVLFPNPDGREGVGYGTLVKPHHPVAF